MGCFIWRDLTKLDIKKKKKITPPKKKKKKKKRNSTKSLFQRGKRVGHFGGSTYVTEQCNPPNLISPILHTWYDVTGRGGGPEEWFKAVAGARVSDTGSPSSLTLPSLLHGSTWGWSSCQAVRLGCHWSLDLPLHLHTQPCQNNPQTRGLWDIWGCFSPYLVEGWNEHKTEALLKLLNVLTYIWWSEN